MSAYSDAYSLDMRQKNARCALGVRHTSAGEHATSTQRVFCVYLALVQRALRVPGFLPSCALVRRALRTFLSMHKTLDAHRTHTANDDELLTLAQRVRRTGGECPAEDDALGQNE